MQGQRVAKSPEGAKKGWIIVAVLAAVLVAAYVGLCIWVGMNDKVFPNVTVAGQNVSGMTPAQSRDTVKRAMEQYGGQAAVVLTHRDWSGTIKGADFQFTGDGIGHAAWSVGRENFLTQGFAFLRHQLGASAQVRLSEVDMAVAMEQPTLAELLEEAACETKQPEVRVDEEILTVTKGVTGVEFDWERAVFLTSNAVLEAYDQAIRSGGQGEVVLDLAAQEVATERPPEQPDFEAIHRDTFAPVQDAQVDPETYTATEHVVGVDFDTKRLKAVYEAAKEGETFSIPLLITQPAETKESLQAKLFADLLGEATSNVSGNANRKFNVKLAAEACNNIVLMPGEEFSYNNTTGSRSADKGYLPAGVYVGGVSMDEVGGGICQVSSTIYYAVLRTTLEVVERHDHVYAVGYVPDGMDATVYFGSLDFRFKNSTNYPIRVVTESYDVGGTRKLTVKLYGTNEDGRYAVPERIQSDWVEPTTSYMADETVPRGTLVLDTQQNAYTGRKAQTYRHIYEENGTFVETQDMGKSTYKMRPHLYHYNPLDGDPATWVDGKPPVPNAQPDPVPPTPETEGEPAPADPSGAAVEAEGQPAAA